MKIVIWIVQILVTIAFFGAGLMTLFTPYADLVANPDMAWAGDFSATQIKIIGALEILGAIGVILPMLLKKYKILVPLAAIGLALTMVGAAIVHLQRGEPIIPNVVLFVLAGLVVYFRKDFFKEGFK